MAKNKTTASTKKQSTPPTPPTPPIPGQDNQGDQTTTTPPATDQDNQGDQTTTATQVIGEGNQVEQTTTTTPAPPANKFTAKCQEVAARYAVSYPTCRAFHFCSDMQVFLDADLKEARAHQAELDGGRIVTIKIN